MTSEQIEVTYKATTPLFCGGSTSDITEIRVSSIKGMLRWWWRALAWPRYEGSEADKLHAIHHDEAELFGSAVRGQSKVILRLLPPTVTPTTLRVGDTLSLDGKAVREGARYLGYGVMVAFDNVDKQIKAGQLTRPCLQAPLEIALELRTRDLEPRQHALLVDAVKALGLLGGLGARSRKGYGSLVLQAISQGNSARWAAPASVDALVTEIVRLLPSAAPSSPIPPYTALSARTRILLVPGREGQPPLELLDLVGRELMRYRSWGHNGKVLGFDREEKFKDDHDLMKLPPEQRRAHPRRIVFGLPHNYSKKPGDQVGPGEDGDRRASPLLIHLHHCGTTPVAVLSFLPARFLSKGDEATIQVGSAKAGGRRIPIARDPALWKPIDDFLARVLDPRRKDVFGAAREVPR